MNGIHLGALVVAYLLFADDTVLVARSPEGLQALLTNAFERSRLWSIDFHPGKCYVILLGGSRPTNLPTLYLGDPTLQQNPLAYKPSVDILGISFLSTGVPYRDGMVMGGPRSTVSERC